MAETKYEKYLRLLREAKATKPEKVVGDFKASVLEDGRIQLVRGPMTFFVEKEEMDVLAAWWPDVQKELAAG